MCGRVLTLLRNSIAARENISDSCTTFARERLDELFTNASVSYDKILINIRDPLITPIRARAHIHAREQFLSSNMAY